MDFAILVWFEIIRFDLAIVFNWNNFDIIDFIIAKAIIIINNIIDIIYLLINTIIVQQNFIAEFTAYKDFDYYFINYNLNHKDTKH